MKGDRGDRKRMHDRSMVELGNIETREERQGMLGHRRGT